MVFIIIRFFPKKIKTEQKKKEAIEVQANMLHN